MARSEAHPRPDKATGPAVPDDPMMDPDATRITTAAMPLERMPPITAANRVTPHAESSSTPDSGPAGSPAADTLPVTTSSSSSPASADAATPDLDLTPGEALPDSAASDDATVLVPGATFKAMAAAAAARAAGAPAADTSPARVPGHPPAAADLGASGAAVAPAAPATPSPSAAPAVAVAPLRAGGAVSGVHACSAACGAAGSTACGGGPRARAARQQARHPSFPVADHQ